MPRQTNCCWSQILQPSQNTRRRNAHLAVKELLNMWQSSFCNEKPREAKRIIVSWFLHRIFLSTVVFSIGLESELNSFYSSWGFNRRQMKLNTMTDLRRTSKKTNTTQIRQLLHNNYPVTEPSFRIKREKRKNPFTEMLWTVRRTF